MIISGFQAKTKRAAKREFQVVTVDEHEFWLADAGHNSCGDRLDWFFTVYGPSVHKAGEDSRSTGVWYATAEDALAAGRTRVAEIAS